ncbi:MAG: type II toxin-antitoxin system PemK/MazF family toxin [bacterium]|nr:type II toxin-antitoxin system PemK/MazF family toxin [bacterium]
MSKGAIVLIPFPFTDLSGQKVRPALVISNSSGEDDCIVAFISSVKQKKAGSFDIVVPVSEESGLKVDSVIKINKLATLQKKIIIGELGYLERTYLSVVDKKLKDLFQV